MNSLRSNSISHFVTQIAHRNQRLNNDSKDLHSSKDLLVRNVFERSEETSAPCGYELCSLRLSKRSSYAGLARPSARALLACYRRDASYDLVASLVEECFRGAPRRQAFSVVGIKETWRTLSVSEGQRPESHTKTLMEGGLCPESTTSSPYRGRLGGGGCFFASFFAPKKVRNYHPWDKENELD